MAKSYNKSKDKSLQEKLKQFFGFKGATPLNFDHHNKVEPFYISPNIIKDILPQSPVTIRLKAIKELCEHVQTKPLAEDAIESLFKLTEDLLQPSNSYEARRTVFQLYCYILQFQLEKMTIMRSVFFRLIKNHKFREDILSRLEMLKRLSENGKNISCFEEEIGPFLLECLPEMFAAEKTVEFLDLLVNVIKCNAAFLDDDIVGRYIEYVCTHCGVTKSEEDIKICLEVMDAVLCYSHLPSAVLQTFIFALCLTVNVEKFATDSWKVMRNLLGTNLGHTSIFILCLFLQNKNNINQPGIIRGAVFFLSMALWGSKKVQALIHPPSAVLPSICMALETNNYKVAFEVVLSIQRLVKKKDMKLEMHTWEIILDIIEHLLKYPELQKPGPPNGTLATSVHDLITDTEEVIVPYLKNRLYNIIENCLDKRSVESVIRLIKHRAQYIKPVKKENFLASIGNLMDKYFKNETRPGIQLYVLEVVQNLYSIKTCLQEDEATEQIILHYLSHLECVQDVSVRKAVIKFLLEIAENSLTKIYVDILDVIEKAMTRPFEILNQRPCESDTSKLFLDVQEAVYGLINVFKKKLYVLPSSHCVRAYNILVNHIMSHYEHLTFFEDSVQVRKKILEFFFTIRTNSKKQVGLINDGKVNCSVYVSCNLREAGDVSLDMSMSPTPGSPSLVSFPTCSCLSFEQMFRVLIIALKQEKDWTILSYMFQELPCLLQNKALVICGQCNINALCSTLSALINENRYPEILENVPSQLTRTEFLSQVYPVISSLPAYRSQMETYMLPVLVRCLQSGLISKSAKVCIEGLTLCTLEMRNIMIKFLPAVLEKFAKISATVSVSISVLEFLSNLIRLPQLYVSFVEDQYRSIFAIALPYTNPFKFNQFTVALAHHVIAMWFLKCRIPFRKEFAKFITKGLQSNIKVPYEKNLNQSNGTKDDVLKQNNENTNSSDSLNSIVTLHSDLFEIGVDFMARFTFGMSSNVPKRSLVADFLLEKGQKSSWMIGNKVITITTSGCGTKAFKCGLCERCYSYCHEITGNLESDEDGSSFSSNPEPFEEESVPAETPPRPMERRRRHQSAFHRRNTTLCYDLETSQHTKDDILLHKQKFSAKKHFKRRNTSYSPEESASLPKQDLSNKKSNNGNSYVCSCWCSGWAEIFIRRPTGNCSWMMKIQNKLFLPTTPPDLSLSSVSPLLLPVKDITKIIKGINGNKIAEILEESAEGNESCSAAFEETDLSNFRETSQAIMCPETNVPIRRANSSPDMNSGWAAFESSIAEKNNRSLMTEDSSKIEDNTNDFKNSDSSEHSRTISGPFFAQNNNKLIIENPSCNVHSNVGSDRNSVTTSAFRDRGHTISVMSPNRTNSVSHDVLKNKDMHRSGMHPSFVFLSLYHNNFFGPPGLEPVSLRPTEANNRALKVLDHIHPYDTHKIGIIYVGIGQASNEIEILGNQYGSLRYIQFLRHLGNIVRLQDVDHEFTYVGGLDIKGADGRFALVWHDDVMRVAFHVATLMPNKPSDQKKNDKKLHIGNDFVSIVYNESGEDYDIGTIKGHVTTACVIIEPDDYNCNVVTVKLKTKELSETFGHHDSYIVSDESLSIFVRQMALHANLAAMILHRGQQSAHISNWLERLRTIKRLHKKVLEELNLKNNEKGTYKHSNIFIDDFTDYV